MPFPNQFGMTIVMCGLEEYRTIDGRGSVRVGQQVLERSFAQAVRQAIVVDGACQEQGANHGGQRHERLFMRAGLTPVGRLTGDEIDHFLDVPGCNATHIRRLACGLRTQRGQGTSEFCVLDMRS